MWYKLTVLLTLVCSLYARDKWPIRRQDIAKAIPDDFDCEMRKAAYEYGKTLLPRMEEFETLWYALNLNSEECHVDPKSKMQKFARAPKSLDDSVSDSNAVYVHPTSGSDFNTGASTSPLSSIQKAADLAASTKGKHYVA